MLVGLFALWKGFTNVEERRWWTIALAIQFFHHIEHLLLQIQAITGHNFFDRPVPTSIVQLWVPRVELHLFYNTIVFIPMAIAMYYHMFPARPRSRRHARARGTGGESCRLTQVPATTCPERALSVRESKDPEDDSSLSS